MSSTDAGRSGRVAIDPRIRARRIEVQRDAGRRRLRRLVDVGLVLAVVAGFAVALRSPLLEVGTVRVSGADHVPAAQITRSSGIRPGQQLMDVHLHRAAAQVAALPWVARVTVRRSVGGTVAIQVTERVPAALVGEGDQAAVVDATGRILAPARQVPEVAAKLIRVTGLPVGLPPGAALPGDPGPSLVLAQRLATAVPGAIAEVTVGPELLATLVQGGQVRFGDASQLPAKLRSLQTVLDEVDLTCLAVMDLEVPASPVLTRRQGCS